MGNPYGGLDTKGGNSRYFDFSEYGDVKFYQIKKEGSHSFDIIPFKASSKNNPLVAEKEISIGDEVPFMSFFIHKNIGPQQKAVICPGSVGKACPICEEADKWKREKGWDSKEYKALKPTQRIIFNLIDADDDDEKVMLFESSHFLFAKELLDEAKAQADKKGMSLVEFDFAGVIDPANAKTVSFRSTTEKGPTGDYFKYKSFSFEERQKKHKKALPFPIDSCMIIKSYEDLDAMFHGETEEEEDEPAPKKAVSRKDDDEDDEPPKHTKVAKDDTPKCPIGMKFGVDTDEKDECEDCDLYSECRAAFKANKRAGRS